jgi:PKD repeat protein
LSQTARRSILALIAFMTPIALAASPALAAPTADFSMVWTQPPSRPSVGQTVNFTGAVSNWDGVEGTLPGAVTWNFGEAGGTATGLTPSYLFQSAGLKFVTMTVTNADDPAESTSVIKVLNVNAPPVAAFSWAPTTATTGQDVRFASESDDPDGSIEQYAWNFGDGVTDARRTPSHPYATPGTKTVTLTVTDAHDAKSTSSRQVVVQNPPVAGPPANKPPIANFAFGPSSPEVGQSVEFVSTAVDPEGDLRSQTWDLDGDGQFDDARGDSVVYTFAMPGAKTVRLRAEDADGGAAVRERTVTVHAAPVAPAGFLRPSPVIFLNGQILHNGARIMNLRVRAPRRALVTVKCRGRGCPVARRRKVVKGSSVRFKTFERFLRAGIRLEILVSKPNTIGDYTRYTIRAGKAPARVSRCLAPGKSSPKRCS